MNQTSDKTNTESVDPYLLTGTECCTSMPAPAYWASIVVGVAVATLSWAIGVLILWASIATLFISNDSFDPMGLVFGQLERWQLFVFAGICSVLLVGSIFLGNRSRRLMQDGWLRKAQITQRKHDLGQQLEAVQTDLLAGRQQGP